MFEHIEFVEPFGHLTSKSKLERYWDEIPLHGALARRRTVGFDSIAGMTTSPMLYEVDALELEDELPTKEWVSNALVQFVRDEFNASVPRAMKDVRIHDVQHLEPDFIHRFARNGENIRGLIPRVSPSQSEDEMAGTLFDLLCDDRVGARKNKDFNSRDEFVRKQGNVIRARGRLLFVLPGFPFKDQNVLRVPFDARYPDLAEVSFLLRLHRLTQIVYQFHPYGADVLVLSDGSAYEGMFGVQTGASDDYLRRLRFIRHQLNLSGTISFLELKDLFDVVRSSARPIEESVRNSIVELRRDPQLRSAFASLEAGMKRNLANGDIFDGLTFDERLQAMENSGSEDSDPRVRDAAQELNKRAVAAASEYAAFNVLLRRIRLIERFFPEAIRGTVHPKPGQFGLNGAAGGFAWNGVAWSETIPDGPDDVRQLPFAELPTERVRQYLFPDGSPAFFGRSTRV